MGKRRIARDGHSARGALARWDLPPRHAAQRWANHEDTRPHTTGVRHARRSAAGAAQEDSVRARQSTVTTGAGTSGAFRMGAGSSSWAAVARCASPGTPDVQTAQGVAFPESLKEVALALREGIKNHHVAAQPVDAHARGGGLRYRPRRGRLGALTSVRRALAQCPPR
jgi:hypothetical protein